MKKALKWFGISIASVFALLLGLAALGDYFSPNKPKTEAEVCAAVVRIYNDPTYPADTKSVAWQSKALQCENILK